MPGESENVDEGAWDHGGHGYQYEPVIQPKLEPNHPDLGDEANGDQGAGEDSQRSGGYNQLTGAISKRLPTAAGAYILCNCTGSGQLRSHCWIRWCT